ncbi:hypothetical protein OKW35_003077 [Paraburkholderia sp. MM5477-R1]
MGNGRSQVGFRRLLLAGCRPMQFAYAGSTSPANDRQHTTHFCRRTPGQANGSFASTTVIRAATPGTLSGLAYGRGSLAEVGQDRAAEVRSKQAPVSVTLRLFIRLHARILSAKPRRWRLVIPFGRYSPSSVCRASPPAFRPNPNGAAVVEVYPDETAFCCTRCWPWRCRLFSAPGAVGADE